MAALAAAAPLLGQVSQGALNFTGLAGLTLPVTMVGLAPAWWVMRPG